MPNLENPGPPLTAEEEYCACAPPTAAEYAKATGAAFLAVPGGALAWFVMVLATERMWGFTLVIVGLLAGWAVFHAAGRHRSVGMAVIASVATVLSGLLGYAMLWLPFVSRTAIDRSLHWHHLIMVALGVVVAYGLTGPQMARKKSE